MFGFNVGVSMTYMKVVSLLQRGARAYASRTQRYIDIQPYADDVDESYEDMKSTYGMSAADDADTDAVLRAADEYLAQVDAPKQVNPKALLSSTTSSYDFASLYGLSSVSKSKEEPVAPAAKPVTPVIDELITPAVEIEEPITPAVKIEEPITPAVKIEEPITPVVEIKEPITPVVEIKEPITPVQQVYEQPRPIIPPVEQVPIQQPQAAPVQQNPVPDLSGMTLKGQAQAISKWMPSTVMPESVLFDAFGKSVILKLVSEGYLVRTKKGIMLGS